jgi:hypothetical protein
LPPAFVPARAAAHRLLESDGRTAAATYTIRRSSVCALAPTGKAGRKRSAKIKPQAAPPAPASSSLREDDAAQRDKMRAPKQGNIDAWKLRSPPARSERVLDVDAILSKLKINLKLPRRQLKLARQPRSVIDCMKNLLVPSRQWEGVDSDDEAPVPEEEKPEKQPARGQAVAGLKLLNAAGKSRRCTWVLCCMLVRGPLRFLADPPLAMPKVFLGLPTALYFFWFKLLRPIAVWCAATCPLPSAVPDAEPISSHRRQCVASAPPPPVHCPTRDSAWPAALLCRLGPLSSYAALCCALPTLVAQCYVVSYPLAAQVAPMLRSLHNSAPAAAPTALISSLVAHLQSAPTVPAWQSSTRPLRTWHAA